jgi:hypothetical protein
MYAHVVVAAVAVVGLGLATTTAPIAQARAMDRQQVNRVTGVKKRPPVAGLKDLLAYLHKHPKFLGKSHAKAVGAVEAVLDLCGAGWNSLSLDQKEEVAEIAFEAEDLRDGGPLAEATVLASIIRFLFTTTAPAGGGANPGTPTGLTVSADPHNGTVMHLTWQDKSNDETAFEVNNGTESRDVSASSGPGTVNYTWTGLTPGSRVCFRVRASNDDTLSNWDPNSGFVCGWTSSPPTSPPPGTCTPKINSVGPTGGHGITGVEITGSCFGTSNGSAAADTAYFRITDLTAGWNGCWTGDPGTDSVTCNISSWTNTSIVFNGFDGAYGEGSWVANAGDQLEFQVWNPQSGKGPATCEVIADNTATTNC